MAPECSYFEDCQKTRIENAEFKGVVTTKLDNIEGGVHAIWGAINTEREDIKKLYVKVGLLSGGMSLVVSLIISLLMKR